MTWKNNFFTDVNISVLRQSKHIRMRAKSALSIITKSCHSLQFIVISQCSVNKLSAQWISYLHVVIMRGFTSLQNSAPDKNSPFWVVGEHLTLSITQIHTGAFSKYVLRISNGAPETPGALSDRLLCLLVKSAPVFIQEANKLNKIRYKLTTNTRRDRKWHQIPWQGTENATKTRDDLWGEQSHLFSKTKIKLNTTKLQKKK